MESTDQELPNHSIKIGLWFCFAYILSIIANATRLSTPEYFPNYFQDAKSFTFGQNEIIMSGIAVMGMGVIVYLFMRYYVLRKVVAVKEPEIFFIWSWVLPFASVTGTALMLFNLLLNHNIFELGFKTLLEIYAVVASITIFVFFCKGIGIPILNWCLRQIRNPNPGLIILFLTSATIALVIFMAQRSGENVAPSNNKPYTVADSTKIK